MKIKGMQLTLANYYGPIEDNTQHLQAMFNEIDKEEPEKLIVVGDFNTVQNISLDKYGVLPRTNFKCQKEIQDWMQLNNMSDIWREKNPNIRKYTWISNTTPKIMSRLDYFLISDSLQGHYNNSDIIPGFMTDHSCVTLTLNLPNPERGKGFWKFNSTLSEDKNLLDQIRNTIDETVLHNREADDCLLWDVIKCQVRGTCIGYASKKNKERREILPRIEEEIQTLEEEYQKQIIETSVPDQEIIDKLEDKKMERQTKGDEVRSRIVWHVEGHKPRKMFLNLEKSRGEAKNIRKLKGEHPNIEFTSKEEILAEQHRYYKNLYSCEQKTTSHHIRRVEEEIWSTEGETLAGEDMNYLTEPINELELWEVIKNSPLNKSPGTDGLTNEFYKEYWSLIKKYLVNSLNTSLETGKLNISQRRGIITLIPKPQKDLEYLKNWRPITLLNQDYKYLTKILGNRIEKSLKYIINSDQSRFVKGRYIGCNIQRLQNLIESCREKDMKGWIVNIDFEKAFDTIEWPFIYKSLTKMGYPEKFVN
jgi:hypothetical protein